MAILRGDKLADKINKQTKAEIKKLKIKPGLAAILIGNNSASKLYVSIKKQEAKKIGVNFYEYHFSTKIKEKEIIKTINLLNKDKNIHGIIVQLPLPKKFNTNKIIQSINPKKDVDGFNRKNIVVSPLVSGSIELLKLTKQNLKNKSAVIISKSKIFTDSFKAELKNKQIKTIWVKEINKNTVQKIKQSDIAIIALGKRKILKAQMIKKGAIVIDIGINKFKGKTIGDVDFEKVKNKASYITPVPKGVGPMTVAILMKNVVALTKRDYMS
ncbi:bifunctional 5,10-methylenetetrahydrofolate dehydrogenase/5,10-methenyltetrahydrofolate cyclohydrolase [Candidatus Falkowbacteria bacterium]|jgi:methylenetetrahydrofolate dehydrogenase (NADP+) / methenyltetrahydrofolate cyclohydrolase|nr:bifunctional 5,10-methylenetetrahydrofolate dehydrogenase/5,10-methenyltetrahydrofolate cyclohydrolase [Candidatus Falkowbacteria bacterium]MBT4433207.1 bifunctional 5,10-methylenetetrahydrofolate dehydrogenase/5,10-methenyltetrahydrofolate cyclohydrolase [Candidatus Falkowbacteria bacterium]